MHPSHLRRVARRLISAIPLTLLLLSVACEGASPRTIGGYCRRDADCVDGLRCLNLVCTEQRRVDGGLQQDQGSPADTGVDVGPADTGVDVGPADTGVDVGPADTGVDTGPEDMGPDDMGPVDMGPEDMGPEDMGAVDMG